MPKKYKCLLSALLLFFLGSGICFAASGSDLLASRDLIFNLLIGFGGTLAVLVFAYGGLRYMTSLGNAGVIKEAKKIMVNAVLGLVILLSCLLIINAINPSIKDFTAQPLTNPTPPPTPVTPPKQPGLYLTNKDGVESSPKTSSESKMSDDYFQKTTSFKIINNLISKSYYGVIFYNDIGFKGTCSDVFTFTGTEGGSAVPAIPADSSSFNFFQYNSGPNYKTSGSGVVFYSRPFGWQAGAKAGYSNITIAQAKTIIDPQTLKFSYNSATLKSEKDVCKTFKDCAGSIEIKGKYLVTVYASGGFCESFFNSEPNLEISWVLNRKDGRIIDKIVIVALK